LEKLSLVGGSEIKDLGTKVLIVQTIVEISGRETLGMSLERVDLLNLAAIWEADILNTEVVLGIISIA